jgi:hypothetical protein
MKIEKIEINKDGDYKLRKDGKLIKCKGILEIYSVGEDLSDRLNHNIIALLESKEYVLKEFVEYIETVEQVKNKKVAKLQIERDATLEYNGDSIDVADILRFIPLMLLSDEKIISKLPIETESGVMIENIGMLKGICELYVDHTLDKSKKIIDTKKATTIEEVENIT